MFETPWWTWWLSGLGLGWCARSVWAWLRNDGTLSGRPSGSDAGPVRPGRWSRRPGRRTALRARA